MEGRRIPAPRQTAERIDELLKGQVAGDVPTELIRLGVWKLVEEVLEGATCHASARQQGPGDGRLPAPSDAFAASKPIKAPAPRAALTYRQPDQ